MQAIIPVQDFQSDDHDVHRVVCNIWDGTLRQDWVWIQLQDDDAAPGALRQRCPAQLRLLFRTIDPHPNHGTPGGVVTRDWAVISIPDAVNKGRQIKPTGSIQLRAKTPENAMVVQIDAMVNQAQVIAIESENGKNTGWIINHRIDLNTFNHIGAYYSYDDDF